MSKLVLLLFLCACASVGSSESEVMTAGDNRLCILVEHVPTHRFFYVYNGECLVNDPDRGCVRYDKNGRMVESLPYGSSISIRPSR